MKKLPIDITPLARGDAIKITDWLDRSSATAADRFVVNMNATVDDLAEMPGMGALYEMGELDFRGLRKKSVRGFPNHLIFYREQGGVLRVIRVLHGAQELMGMLEGEWR